jgi:hypothetical protein
MLFAWESEPQSALGRWAKRAFSALVFGGLFLLPFFAYLAAEPTPYRDPAGQFSLTPPEGWATDDSGHMGAGLVAKGPADAAGAEPLLHLTYEPAGIVTLEVRWQTLLGQLRFDSERVKFLAIEEHPDATPPYAQAAYTYTRGDLKFRALTRLLLARGQFYQMTAAAPEAGFEALQPALVAAFDSLRTGGK